MSIVPNWAGWSHTTPVDTCTWQSDGLIYNVKGCAAFRSLRQAGKLRPSHTKGLAPLSSASRGKVGPKLSETLSFLFCLIFIFFCMASHEPTSSYYFLLYLLVDPIRMWKRWSDWMFSFLIKFLKRLASIIYFPSPHNLIYVVCIPQNWYWGKKRSLICIWAMSKGCERVNA